MRSFFCLFILGALYWLCVTLWPPLEPYVYSGQWEANRGRAQCFLFGEEKRALIIGSSLSARISMPLEDKIYNLGFNGGSAMTGLELVSRAENTPKLIIVETNFIERGLDEKLINNVDSIVARRVPLFRIENRPLNYFLSFIHNRPWEKQNIQKKNTNPPSQQIETGKSSSDVEDSTVKVQRHHPKQAPPGPAFSINIEQKKRNEAAGVNPKILFERIKQLQFYIDKLEQRGAKVLFFEMPVNSQLQTGKRITEVREFLRSHFPSQYFLDMSKVVDFSSFVTEDGVHLAGAECQFFASHLRDEIKKQLP